MPIYVVHATGRDTAALERARFVSDRFSWPAAVFGVLWLAYQRLWLASLLWIVFLILLALAYSHLSVTAVLLIFVLGRLYLGCEGNRLRAGQAVRTAVFTDIIEAANRSEAEAIFFRQFTAAERPGELAT